MKKKLLSFIFPVVLVATMPGMSNFGLIAAYADNVAEKEADVDSETEEKNEPVIVETIKISSAEDFVTMAEEARTQSYSYGKIFSLESDIDLSEYVEVSVPFMDGYFNGNGHKISGLSLSEDNSDYALFRYLGENGQIKNLVVNGTVTGGDEQQHIAIICGNNSGVIDGCTVFGTVNGQSQTGGVAGFNAELGIIKNCSNSAVIDGKFQTGGIAGENEGIIENCTNLARINTAAKVKKNKGESDGSSVNISIPNAVTGLAADERANETGGIAGYSKGVISDCTNRGVIGYKQLGSATGGIVGHQYGRVERCENVATIYGHKMVGGIAGYFEAYDSYNYDTDYVEQLRDQLDELADIVDELAEAGDSLGTDFSNNTDVLSDEIKVLRSSLQSYEDGFEADIDASRGSIRSQADYLQCTVDSIDYDFRLRQISDSVDKLKHDTEKMSEILAKLRLYTDGMDAGDYATMIALIGALESYKKDAEKFQALMAKLEYILSGSGIDISDIIGALGSSPDDDDEEEDEEDYYQGYSNNSGQQPGSSEGDSEESDDNSNSEEDSNNDSNDDSSEDESDNNNDSSDDTPDSTPESEDSAGGADETPAADDGIGPVAYHIEKTMAFYAASNEEETVESLLKKLVKYDKDARKQIDRIHKYMKRWPDEAEEMEDDFKSIRGSLDNIYGITKDLADKIDARGDIMKIDVRAQGDVISDTVDYTQDVLDADWDRFNNNISNLTDKIHDLRSTVSDGYDDLRKIIDDKSIYVDVSELADSSVGSGKIISSKNSGEIYADSLGGGVVGSIDKDDSTSFALDTVAELWGRDFISDKDDEEEDENEKDSLTKHVTAVVYDCKNTADVFTDSDYAGGIVGRAAFGLIQDSKSFGNISADDGSYVGGIAGYSKLSIKNACMLGGLLGNSYVGGIAGKAKDISSSYTCAYMDMDGEMVKATGAVAGASNGTVSGNYFVDNGCGAVDGVTKSDEALGITYKELCALRNMPPEFKHFTVRFIDEDEVVWSGAFSYGDEFKDEDYPELTAREGEYVYWEDKQISPVGRNITVHAIRRVFMPSIQATDKYNEKPGKPDLIIGGRFYPDSALSVERIGASDNQQIIDAKNSVIPDIHYVITKSYHYAITQDEEFDGNASIRVLKDKIPSNMIMILDKDYNVVVAPVKAVEVESYLSYEGAICQEGYVVVIDFVSKLTVVAAVIILLVLLVLLVFALMFVRRKRKALVQKIRLALAEDEELLDEGSPIDEVSEDEKQAKEQEVKDAKDDEDSIIDDSDDFVE